MRLEAADTKVEEFLARDSSCRNCGSEELYRLGLCVRCFLVESAKAVRTSRTDRGPVAKGERRPSASEYATRDWSKVSRDEYEPTDAPPGSDRKIEVMHERAAKRLPIFHPLDNLGMRRELMADAQ